MENLTEGQRIYAIGDIHGCLDLLDDMLARIDRDLADRPHPAPMIVFLGDYDDRGPDTPGVINRLIDLKSGPRDCRFLLGNHDNYITEFLKDPGFQDIHLHWLNPRMGGDKTLMSYGVDPALLKDLNAARDAFEARLPERHLAFLANCELSFRLGGYIFAHAGIRPGVALENQVKEDLIWIRDDFLNHRDPFEGKVVHGHTVVPMVQHHGNRIAVDTGAFRTGLLSCVVLQDNDVWVLDGAGLRSCPVGTGLSGTP